MYITSTINPLTRTDANIDVVVVIYQQTRRFICRPKRYVDLVSITKEALWLDPDTELTFSTSTLDICRGHNVAIDPTAYEMMYLTLDELTVVINAGKQKSERVDDAVRETQDKVMAPQAPTIPSSSRREEPKDKNIPAIRTAGTFRAEEDAEPSIEILPEAKPSHVAGTSKGSAESSLTRALDCLDRTLDRLDNGIVPRNEEEEEGEEEEEEQLVADEWEENPPNFSRNEALDEELEISSPPSPEKSTNQTSTSNKASRKSISITVSTKMPAQAGPANTDEEPTSSRPVQVQSDPEARYNVVISGPGPDQEAEFKTRGKHLVKKVLAAACKTFKLDLTRARLIVPKVVNGQIQYFECPMDQTMAKCGVETGEKFFIHMDEEVDELQDD